MKKILVAEDESAIREIIAINLTRAGYEVVQAADGKSAFNIFQESPLSFDVVLLDIMMPTIDGVTVCKAIREADSTIGIILLTAKTQESDKITGLKSGADDYITKPFSVNELLARVEAVCRRVEMMKSAKTERTDEIISGEYVLSIKKRSLFDNGNQIELSQIEFQILELLLSNSGKTFERSEILEYAWGDRFYGDDKVVDVNIRRLRIKVEKNPSSPEHLITVRGKGYKWVE
ncbi:MAG: response regulator transcription factor [Acutalibacteraceae bacterium]